MLLTLLILSQTISNSFAYVVPFPRHKILYRSVALSMSSNPMPKLPLPPPLLSLTPGTWAHDTMSRRIDAEILQRTFEENEEEFLSERYSTAFENFQMLRKDLRSAETTLIRHLAPLNDSMSNDSARNVEYLEWKHILQPYVDTDSTWLSTPWMIAEFYLYRRLMEALGYFDPTSSTFHYDPFAKQKRQGLVTSVATAEPILKQVTELKNSCVEDGFALAAAFALWGNKMDLSIWPADGNLDHSVFEKVLASANDNLLHDDTERLVTHGKMLMEKGGGNIDIIVDNAGFELIMDLALADYLITSGIAKCVTFQLKAHPTFVSDAMEKDLREHVKHYTNLEGYENSKLAGKRWLGYLESGQWICREDNFWVQPPPMWDMPNRLRNDLKERCDLAFVKGDANYRRLLGDLEWDYSAPFEDVVGNYFPCPVCALRTLKAEVGCGMDEMKWKNAKKIDDKWMVNGRFGVVHFSLGAK